MMRDVAWERMQERMNVRVKTATEDLKREPLNEHDWVFRYYNDVPILLDEINRLRKLNHANQEGKER